MKISKERERIMKGSVVLLLVFLTHLSNDFGSNVCSAASLKSRALSKPPVDKKQAGRITSIIEDSIWRIFDEGQTTDVIMLHKDLRPYYLIDFYIAQAHITTNPEFQINSKDVVSKPAESRTTQQLSPVEKMEHDLIRRTFLKNLQPTQRLVSMTALYLMKANHLVVYEQLPDTGNLVYSYQPFDPKKKVVCIAAPDSEEERVRCKEAMESQKLSPEICDLSIEDIYLLHGIISAFDVKVSTLDSFVQKHQIFPISFRDDENDLLASILEIEICSTSHFFIGAEIAERNRLIASLRKNRMVVEKAPTFTIQPLLDGVKNPNVLSYDSSNFISYDYEQKWYDYAQYQYIPLDCYQFYLTRGQYSISFPNLNVKASKCC